MQEEVRKLIHDLRETAPEAWRYLVQDYAARELFMGVTCLLIVIALLASIAVAVRTAASLEKEEDIKGRHIPFFILGVLSLVLLIPVIIESIAAFKHYVGPVSSLLGR